jgi:hypothetical protein
MLYIHRTRLQYLLPHLQVKGASKYSLDVATAVARLYQLQPLHPPLQHP